MAYYSVNGTSLTSIFSTNTSLNAISFTTNYKQSSTDIQNQFGHFNFGDTNSLNSEYQHVNNTNYNVNGVDIKTLFLPYYQEFTSGSGTLTIPSWCHYIKAMLIGGGGGGGGGNSDYVQGDFQAGSSGGGGAFVNTQSISVTGGSTLTYNVGVLGSGGGLGGNGGNGGNSTISYSGTTYTAGGGGFGYGGSGNGNQYGSGGIAYGSSSLNHNGYDGIVGGFDLYTVNSNNTGLSGTSRITSAYWITSGFYSLFSPNELVGGVPFMGGNSGFTYTYQNIQNANYGLGGAGGFGTKSAQGNTGGISGNGGYIRIYYSI